MFGLRPTNLEVGYTASSALPAVLGKMVARWHKNRAVPKSACEKTDSGTKTELSHRETAETGGWLRAIMLSDGKTPGRRISQARLDFHASFILWDSSVFVPGFASARVFFGAHPHRHNAHRFSGTNHTTSAPTMSGGTFRGDAARGRCPNAAWAPGASDK